jgi:hypothetical protein
VAVPCGDPLQPSATTCPGTCTGGCFDDVCYITCDEDQECNQPINCPPGLPCQVTCNGLEACRHQVHCDDDYPCSVSCTGDAACKGAELFCGSASACEVLCGASPEACQGLEVHCGGGICNMQCVGDVIPQYTCGESCDCTVCERPRP